MLSSLPEKSANNRGERGVSLIESLMVVVSVGAIVILMANLPNAMGLVGKSRHLSLAREIAAKQLEDKRAINFANLVSDTTPISDTRISLLPEGSGSVTVSDCDPLICTNGEHLKKIQVTLSWKDNNKVQTISLDTFIGEGGLNQ